MNAVQACYLLTDELITDLQDVAAENRDNAIAKIQDVLSKREQLLLLIKPPFSEQEALVGKRLLQQQKKLDLLLLKVKQDIQKDINGLSQKKTSMNRYTNPYANMQTDGFFYDKRK